MKVHAVVLAGGQGRRMENLDKGLVLFNGKPMIDWVIEAVAPYVKQISISCNRNLSDYEQRGYALISDQLAGYQGPLAGIHAAMHTMDSDSSHLLVLPCDTPLVEPVLIQRLLESAKVQPEAISVLCVEDQPHFLHAVIPLQYLDHLDQWLAAEGRAPYRWYKHFPVALVDATDQASSLANLNRPGDLAGSEK